MPDPSSKATGAEHTGALPRVLMRGTDGWTPRSLAMLSVICLALAGLIPAFPHLPVFRPENQILNSIHGAVVTAGVPNRVADFQIDLEDGSRLSLPRPFADDLRLRAELASEHELEFQVTDRCLARVDENRCDIWAILNGADTLLGPQNVYATELRASRPYLFAMVAFFGLMGGLGLYQSAHIRKRTGTWSKAVPSVSRDTIEAALSVRDVADPDEILSMVEEAQRRIRSSETKVTWGALGISALLLGFVKLMPESWNRPLDPTTVFGGIALLAALFGLLDVAWQARTWRWSSTPCRILHTTVLQKDKWFVPAVFFEYRFGRSTHRSWKVQITGPQATFADAHARSDRYSVGSEVRCHVNTASPDQAVLEQSLNLIGAKVAVAFVVGAAFLGWLMG